MNIRWFRLSIAAVLAEAAPIALLVALVSMFGPADAGAAQGYAESLGRWVGPLGGAAATFLAAIWVARPLAAGQVVHGGVLGVLVALLDAALLVAGSAGFELLFVLSGLGRIVAGTLGGFVGRGRP